ncbi:hypothetical protein D5Q97_23480 [Salmonella enterica]|uniref:RIIB-like protein n=1 Tax=Salmonella enterica TaxID=28901 RepID=A0A5T9SKG1_SALER|nr:hypothetical protein [Salmonella enterica]
MKTEMLTIVALAVDSHNLTMWKPDGSTVVIPQGDHRVARIVIEAKEKGLRTGNPVEVNIAEVIPQRTEFNDAEKNTNGFVKFFKIAKAKLLEFIQDGTGDVPAPVVPDIKLGSPTEQMVTKAVDTFVAVSQAVKPKEMVEEDGCYDKHNNLLWITGFDKVHDRVALIRFIMDITHRDSEEAALLANTEWPIALASASDDVAFEFNKRAKQISGVKFIITDRDTTPKAYVEPVAKSQPGIKQEPTNKEKLDAASEKLQALGAIGTDNADFHKDVAKDEVMIAVTPAGVVPGVESLQRHLRQASKLKDYKGFSRFLERLAPVVKDRRHSAEDLMKFMETAELPIADDGCILFLKRLRSKGTDDLGRRVFVDCHSGNIRQWVGCKVQVREDLVDPDRRRDCSNGLHVASMSYIRGFSGDVTILGKVAPEDVFAVPEYSTNKMRVSAYHILAELPEQERTNVNSGVYLSKTEVGKKLLNDAIVGNHQSPTDLVVVGGHYGGNLKYTQLSQVTKEQIRNTASKEAINMEEKLNEVLAAEPVTPADVKPVAEPVEIKPAKAPTVKEQILELVKEFQNATSPEDKLAAADLLVELRGKAKKPWAAFGVDSSIVDALARARSTQERLVEAKAEPVKAIPAAKAVRVKPGNGKHADTIRSWLNDSGMSDYQKAHSIHDLKRAAKKSYAALGLTEEECKAIDKLKHHLK